MGSAIGKLLGIFVVIAVFTLGFFLDSIGFKAISIFTVIATLAAIVFVPAQFSLFFIISFIWFQGFFKIISNYHPIVHVGADLVVLALLFKVLFVKPATYKEIPPFTALFLLHFTWVIVTCFNPYSLSIVSSIAGAKVYVTMFLLYFFGYYLTNNLRDVKKLFALFIILTIAQTAFTIYQGFIGPSSIVSLHPGYQIQLNRYIGYAFRPFGLTNLPGGPSVYIFPVIPLLAYFIYAQRFGLLKVIYISFLPLMGTALFFCQVRSAIAKAVIASGFFVVGMVTSRLPISAIKRAYALMGTAVIAVFTVFAMSYLMTASITSYEDNEMSIDRSSSTFDVGAMATARRGGIDRFVAYVQQVPFGAGFSRVGAASGAFEGENKNDVYFKPGYFFSDNLFIHLLIELGIPGLIILTMLIGCILFAGLRVWRGEKRRELIGPQLAILSALLAIAAGSYGAEGIIYNPESGFFWLFAGVMMSMRRPDFSVEG